MIVVAVVAILAAIAYPSYQNHVQKLRRNAAAGCALEIAQYMERHYTTRLSYEAAGGGAPPLPALQCRQDLAAFYGFALGNVGQRTYTVSAAPSGAQSEDKCGTLSIDHAGTKDSTGSASECW